MNTTRWYLSGAGTQTSGIAALGATPSQVSNVETWNGTSWTETTNANTARDQMCDGAGVSDSNALVYGGATPPASALTEFWNGTSWTEVADLATGRYALSGCGTQSAALATGGAPTLTATEIWDKSLTSKTVTVS